MKNFYNCEKGCGEIRLNRVADQHWHGLFYSVSDKLRQIAAEKRGRRNDAGRRVINSANHASQNSQAQTENQEYNRENAVQGQIENEYSDNQHLCERNPNIAKFYRYPSERNQHAQHYCRDTDEVDRNVEGVLVRGRVSGQHMHEF
jgi:hypothetical protein